MDLKKATGRLGQTVCWGRRDLAGIIFRSSGLRYRGHRSGVLLTRDNENRFGSRGVANCVPNPLQGSLISN